MISIVLHQPEIPPNTGNIIRLTSNIGCQLHLIEPLGFSLDEKRLRRAGLDYHEFSTVLVHPTWEAFKERCQPTRVIAFSTKGQKHHTDHAFAAGDFLLFGSETQGLPEKLRTSSDISTVLRLPMVAVSRSLNLSNSVAVAAYEAWRQLGYPGAKA
ncbi:MAG: tRNA (cytidine(34)-2'-O)-methyltransferase [Pseudomonadota bacterium]